MSIGKGIAICGIWGAVAVCSFLNGSDVIFVAICAVIATYIVA